MLKVIAELDYMDSLYLVTFYLKPPSKDGNVNGITVDITHSEISDYKIISITSDETGSSDVTIEKVSPSTEQDEILEDEIREIDWEHVCTITRDSHWDCYCKYQEVCGCGCDELHDGW